ncbi:DUF3179 domain-containing protein [Natronosalvus halobius]|uniref:DUF3179 domain-containing protein n=1 Tax=Natronosalvus halobius TaxID=2953746 RepID=UPI00209F0667|nr:DUF3179 domain-containing protein [Natronosalvus halobius]USZ71648.1 DUF3179 domain-containing protein [Natronosalvus halobius]
MNVRQVIPRDAIPSIDDPRFGPDHRGPASDEAVVLETEDGSARAYPLRILDYHEVVNDEVSGAPVAVTWCPLCASAVVYDAVVDGRRLTFGVSGKLADDDLVLYDRETDSEWKQSSGVCIDGSLEEARLSPRASSLTTVERFSERYPDGRVLQPVPDAESEAASENDDPAPVDYDERPYAGYFASDEVGLAGLRGDGDGDSDGGRTWNRTDLEPKAVVLGIERAGDALGIPVPWVREAGGVLTASVGESEVVVLAGEAGIHAFEAPDFALEFGRAVDVDVDVDVDATGSSPLVGDGTTWDPVTGESEDGRRLEAVPAKRLFAFAWCDDHGQESLVDR